MSFSDLREMPEPFKNMFNLETITKVASAVQATYGQFPKDEFIASVMDETWNGLELMARARKISICLGNFLPNDYAKTITILEKALAEMPYAFFFQDFIILYGQDVKDWDVSVEAMKRNTEKWSAEFAVRYFIINNEKRMMERMYEWSRDENEDIRRLSSEGCRPLLPWGKVLSSFVKDPSPILPILEELKNDPSKYVMKSVANNLNDISKNHPELVVRIAMDWYGKNERTDWIVKHGCRTLLKKGNREVLDLFGYHEVDSIHISDLRSDRNSISFGEDVSFSFEIEAKKDTKVRMEYGIDFVRSNGKRNRKIFQISEISMKCSERKTYNKKHSFADVSVRKHYPGIHTITLIVNGVAQGTLDVELKLQ